MSSISSLLQAFFICKKAEIVCAYLYGSVARGEARQESDVDVAVLYAQDPPQTLEGLGLALADCLEQLLARPVDLLSLNRAPVDLGAVTGSGTGPRRTRHQRVR